MARGATLAACWVHEPQPIISNHPVRLVSTPCGAVSTRGTTVLFPRVLDLEPYGRISDPGMGPYPPRVTLAPRTPAKQQSARGVGVATPCGAVSTRRTPFSSPVCWSWSRMVRFLIGDETLSSPGGAGSTNPSQSARGVVVATPCWAVSTGVTTVFVPCVELEPYGNISDPGMGSYPPRVVLAPIRWLILALQWLAKMCRCCALSYQNSTPLNS